MALLHPPLSPSAAAVHLLQLLDVYPPPGEGQVHPALELGPEPAQVWGQRRLGPGEQGEAHRRPGPLGAVGLEHVLDLKQKKCGVKDRLKGANEKKHNTRCIISAGGVGASFFVPESSKLSQLKEKKNNLLFFFLTNKKVCET